MDIKSSQIMSIMYQHLNSVMDEFYYQFMIILIGNFIAALLLIPLQYILHIFR